MKQYFKIIACLLLSLSVFSKLQLNNSNKGVVTYSDLLEMEFVIETNGTTSFSVTFYRSNSYLGIGYGDGMLNVYIFYQDMTLFQLNGTNIIVRDYEGQGLGNRPQLSEINKISNVQTQRGINYISSTFTRQNPSNDINETNQWCFAWGYASKELSQHTQYSVKCFNFTYQNGQITTISQGKPIVFFHGIFLSITWGVISSTSILIIRFWKNFVWTMYIHGTLFFISNILTITFISIILANNNKNTPPTYSLQIYERSKYNSLHFAHFVIGVLILAWSILQNFCGIILSFFIQKTMISPKIIVMSKFFHKISGYLLFILTTCMIIIGWILYEPFVGLIVFAIILGIVYIIFLILNIFNPMNKKPQDIQEPIINVNEYFDNKAFVIYQDRIYKLYQNQNKQLLAFHPGGRLIVKNVAGREIDRFLYGMYGVQNIPQMSSYLHYNNSIAILGSPIGRIQNKNIMDINLDWQIVQKQYLNSHTAIIYFKSQDNKIKNFQKGYEWMGKYFMMQETTNQKQKRLYTEVLCMTKSNRKFINQIYQYIVSKQIGGTPSPVRKPDQNDELFPLVIKKYEFKNNFSRFIHQSQKAIFKIVGPRGEGLKLQSGNYLICAAGTGYLPFLDLFDFLFKKVAYDFLKQKHPSEWYAFIISQNVNPFKNDFFFKGKIILVATFPDQDSFIYQVYLQKLIQLNNKHFDMKVRISKPKKKMDYYVTDINATLKLLCKQTSFFKVIVCGPPRFNYEIPKLIQEQGLNKQMIHLL